MDSPNIDNKLVSAKPIPRDRRKSMKVEKSSFVGKIIGRKKSPTGSN